MMLRMTLTWRHNQLGHLTDGDHVIDEDLCCQNDYIARK